MERQLDLRLATDEERAEALRTFLRPVELASRLVSALCVIVARGDQIQIGTHAAVKLSLSKSDASQASKRLKLAISPNTWAKAVAELERRRIVGVLRTTQPWTYVLSLEALGGLQAAPQDDLAALAELPCFRPGPPEKPPDRQPVRSGAGQVPVMPGQAPRVRVESNLQNPCTPCTVVSATRPAGLTDRCRLPWHRRDGLTGDDLVWSVASGELDPIRRLYREGKQLEWIGTSEDDLLRFLTAVHHCATSAGLSSRMGALTCRVKRDPIDVSRTKQASEQWAAGVIRKYAKGEACAT